MMEPTPTVTAVTFWVLQTHSVPTWGKKCCHKEERLFNKEDKMINLIFGIDEAVVDELFIVAVLADPVDGRCCVNVLWRSHLPHALQIKGSKLTERLQFLYTWNSILPSCIHRAETL